MNFKCIKSIFIGEQDTSIMRAEVFTVDVEYPCIDGFLTDNIGVKRSIDKPKFKEHFEPIGEVVELKREQNKSNTLIAVVENLTETLCRYEVGFKRIEQLANVPMTMGTAEMYMATRSIISVCDELKRMPVKQS